jgi:hypothetical protein
VIDKYHRALPSEITPLASFPVIMLIRLKT